MEEKSPTTALVMQEARQANNLSIFTNAEAFEHGQRIAKMLATSTIVPKDYQNNIANCIVAVEMAGRTNDSPLMIMQNLDIIFGKPGFNSKFIIAKVNTCGQFSKLRFRYTGEGDARSCVAYATDLSTGDELVGPPCSIAMAKKKGWWDRKDSNWPSQPELMLMYRAATYFGRMYAPELTMGMQTADEIKDHEFQDAVVIDESPAAEAINILSVAAPADAPTASTPRPRTPRTNPKKEVPVQPAAETPAPKPEVKAPAPPAANIPAPPASPVVEATEESSVEQSLFEEEPPLFSDEDPII